ncbi:aryl-alcohol dehydrogenase-like predicted oxidoreductase [Mycobacterium sp. MAA66]
MSFGRPGSGMDWALDEGQAAAIFRSAVELGITFWDTANMYGAGSSEEITGAAINTYTRRDQIVLATKVWARMGEGPGGQGLSRRAIFEQVDASLRRLGTDYIDLYQIHRFDPNTPVEETMEALHDVVKAGKARYLGASSMWAWQFGKMQHSAQLHGWTPFVSMQDQYHLLQREEEREMFPLLADQGVGAIPWSPLGGGYLTRPWGVHTTARGSKVAQSHRDNHGRPTLLDGDEKIVGAVERVAGDRGVSMAQVAMAWVLRHPAVNAPIIGPTKTDHLTDAAAAVDLTLTTEEIRALEEHYFARQPTFFQ